MESEIALSAVLGFESRMGFDSCLLISTNVTVEVKVESQFGINSVLDKNFVQLLTSPSFDKISLTLGTFTRRMRPSNVIFRFERRKGTYKPLSYFY